MRKWDTLRPFWTYQVQTNKDCKATRVLFRTGFFLIRTPCTTYLYECMMPVWKLNVVSQNRCLLQTIVATDPPVCFSDLLVLDIPDPLVCFFHLLAGVFSDFPVIFADIALACDLPRNLVVLLLPVSDSSMFLSVPLFLALPA